MMPGNYARQLFNSSHDILFANVENNERKQLLGEFLTKFNDMRCMYRCANPLVKLPENFLFRGEHNHQHLCFI